MRHALYCVALFAVLCTITATAQPHHPPTPFCATDAVVQAQHLADPAAARRMEANNRLLYALQRQALERQALERKQEGHRPLGAEIYTIPVVVHIVHNDGPENISDAQAQQAIRDMNDAFANVGYYDSTTGVDVGIRFCLARQDPAGNATTGITRTRSALTDLYLENDDITLKDLVRWDPQRYLNIWVIREINSISMGAGVAGYAFFPDAHGQPNDGIVGEARWFGTTRGYSAIFAHEAGHYLGLYHTFQGGCGNGDCLSDGDGVCDTPPDKSTASVSCAGSFNSCGTDPDDPSTRNPFRAVALGGLGDVSDLHTDYMDYGDPNCYSVFTDGQRERMRAALTSIRFSLLDSKGCRNPCPNPFAASFRVQPGTIYVGSSVQFTNTTGGASSYTWSADGVRFSTATSPRFTFTSKGRHTVTLTASNGDPNCDATFTMEIDVQCATVAAFVAPERIEPGKSVTLRSTSTNATSYRWLVDGANAATGTDLTLSFAAERVVRITLIAVGQYCNDTLTRVVRVSECGPDKRGNIWYFGYSAGIDFNVLDNQGYPTPLRNGAGNNREGFASMCDSNGAILFYTDGQTIYDRNHRQMRNSTAMNGGFFAAQVLIVPQPDNPGLYYIFTVNNWTDPTTELRYTIVDMRLNGGDGAVTRSNSLLHGNAAECIAGAYHANCRDVWIVTHEKATDNYVAFLLTAGGLGSQPVISRVGTPLEGGNRYGSLRFSPDTRRLCRSLGGGNATSPTVELVEFDNATGTISNPVTLDDGTNLQQALSSEFSPNGRYLYTGNFVAGGVVQFDLESISPGNVQRQTISANAAGCLHIGPDGRIYITRMGTSTLDVIDFPDRPGSACGYRPARIALSGSASLGLQNLIAGIYKRGITLIGPQTACSGTDVIVTAKFSGCATSSVRWETTGPGTIVASDDRSATVRVSDTGTVNVIVERTDMCTTTSDTIAVRAIPVPPLDLGSDTILCADSMTLDAGPGFVSYRWQDGSARRTFRAPRPGTYWVETRTADGCLLRDTIVVLPAGISATVDLGPDTALCGETVIVLDAGPVAISYRWQDGSTRRQFTAFGPGTYWVTVTDLCGRTATDTIVISQGPNAAPTPSLGSDTSVCGTASVTLDAGPGFSTYRWSDGSTERTLVASTPGIYWVEVSNPCGTARDTIEVHLRLAQIDIGEDTVICRGDSITLVGPDGATAYRWSTGATARTITATDTGTYWVEARLDDCVAHDTIRVTAGADVALMASVEEIAPSASVAPGDTLAVSLRVASALPHGRLIGAPYRAVIRVDKSMLLPVAPTPEGTFDGDDRVITLDGIVPASDTLAVLRFRAMLGRASNAEVMLASFDITAGCIGAIVRRPGLVTVNSCGIGTGLLDIETAPAARLAVNGATSGGMAHGESIVIDYTLPAAGYMALALADARGVVVRTLASGEAATAGAFTVTVPTTDLATGLYVVTLRTSGGVLITRVLVVK